MLNEDVALIENRPNEEKLRHSQWDEWRVSRIWISSALGVWFAASEWALEFWPVSAGQPIRAFVDLSRPLLLVFTAGSALVLSILAIFALLRHQIRRAASSFLAILMLPICFLIVANFTLFDPWLWYALVNQSHFRAYSPSGGGQGPKYALLEDRDVSTGLSGVSSNHFTFLIYDESDEISLDPSERSAVWQTRTVPGFGEPFPQGRHLYGHMFRVDYFD